MTAAAPADLELTREELAAVTGSPLGDIGISPDGSHLSSGGYHCGAFDLRAINAVGNDDYSIRQPRDRGQYNADLAAGRNLASAMDYPDDWPNGGRAAWIRFNNLLRHQLGIQDPALAALRGVNYTPDGTTKRRFDCHTLTESSTTDTVTWHTHIEWWRDTWNQVQRRWAKDRLVAIARSAITGQPLDAVAPPPAPIIIPDLTEAIMLVTCTNGSGTEQAINGPTVPPLGRVVLTPNGPISCSSGNVGGFDTTYWKNTLQLTWTEIKYYCDKLVPAQAPTPVTVDASAAAAALVADPALGQLIEDRAYAAAQHAESS